jgi:hypothetical protein
MTLKVEFRGGISDQEITPIKMVRDIIQTVKIYFAPTDSAT